MTEKTPLNELIEEIEKERDSYGWDKYTMNMFKDIIDIAKSKLPKERQNLIDAYSQGVIDMAKDSKEVSYKCYLKEKFNI